MTMPGSENSITIMFHYIYVLQSLKLLNKVYIGFTNNLQKRLKERNRSLNFSTKPYMPWQMIFCEAYKNEKDARRREKYLKTNQGARLLKHMLKEYFYEQKMR